MAEGDTATWGISRWDTVAGRDELLPAVDTIFFEASATKSFLDDKERSAFRERWLGRYLQHFPQYAFLAFSGQRCVCGYVIGSIDDPVRLKLFQDISYFAAFSSLTKAYPAQLHVNVASTWRNQGVGTRLVRAFCDEALGAGAPGVHVVTQKGARNVPFYERLGFSEKGHIDLNGRKLVFLGRTLRKD